jgi:hypothetical protein
MMKGIVNLLHREAAALEKKLAGNKQAIVHLSDSGKTPTRRKMSAAARKKISDAQKNRWAASKRKAA